MCENKVNKVDDRIANYHEPHIRGIVRGKIGTKIEFGPKIVVSKVNGYIVIDKISFANFNEGETIKDVIKEHNDTYGFYPLSARADQIYRIKENKLWCKKKILDYQTNH